MTPCPNCGGALEYHLLDAATGDRICDDDVDEWLERGNPREAVAGDFGLLPERGKKPMTKYLQCTNPDCGSNDVMVDSIQEMATGDGSIVDVYTVTCRQCEWISMLNRYVGPPRDVLNVGASR